MRAIYFNKIIFIFVFQSRGFGHIDFVDNATAKKALAKVGEYIDGRAIKVDLSAPKKTGGFGGGGFGGGSFGGNRGGNGGRGGFRGGRGGGGRY